MSRKSRKRRRAEKRKASRAARIEKRKQAEQPEMQPVDEPVELRRWEAAQTNRLNHSHWVGVPQWRGHSINDDLLTDLDTLRARCTYEASNSPMVEGVVETHAADVAGEHGPRLQVVSSNDRYNREVEAAVAEFLATPEYRNELNTREMVRLWVRQLWLLGCFVNQKVSMEREGPFSLGLNVIDPRRKETPAQLVGQPNVAFGARYDQRLRPQTYYLRRQRQYGGSSYVNLSEYDPIPADMIQHCFIRQEAEQLEGVPMLAPALPVCADIRDYDQEVMDAARQAALRAVYWYTEDPRAEYVDYGQEAVWNIERGMQQAGPPGYKPAMLEPTQPTSMYSEYRHERFREFGRPVHMPLMKVLLSSERQNFSSAHYDDQVYVRAGVIGFQDRVEVWSLNPLVDEIAQEVRLNLGIRKPREVRYVWTWGRPPYVNPKDWYTSLRMRLEDGTIAPQQISAAFGDDWEEVQRLRARANDLLDELELPRPPANVGSFQPSAGMMDDGGGEVNDEESADEDQKSDTVSSEST